MEAKTTFWASGLNEVQLKAVTLTEGPVLILAGAGSGKTKTLTHRIAYLIAEKRVAPDHILAVTFTNKAAGEMRGRVETLLAKDHGRLPRSLSYIGTFHSLCARLLRSEIEVLGYSKDFNIVDDQDQQSLVKQVLKELEISVDQVKPRSLLEMISRAKNAFQSPEELGAAASSYYEELLAKVYDRYAQLLRRANALDFDDLIVLVVKLFQTHPEILKKYQEQFRYIMVDEYQDTNRPQYLFVSLLAAAHRNIFVIGDDYQSIYGWRQADVQNILNFEKDYPDATILTLEQNYRSTQTILDAAQGVIDNNTVQHKKKLWTAGEAGAPVSLVMVADETEEARFVAEEIKRRLSDGESAGHFAVLYRTNAQSRSIEEALLTYSLPYKIVGGLKFYQRKEIKDMVCLTRFFVNPHDFLALERVLGCMGTGIGKTSLARWSAVAEKTGESFLEVAWDEEQLLAAGVSLRKIKEIQIFLEPLIKLAQEIKDGREFSVQELLEELALKSGYLDSLRDGTSEGETREENVKELFSVAKKYKAYSLAEGLRLFLEEVALASDTDELETSAPAVQLMTVHSAKGLEFEVVFLVGLEEGIFPHSRSALSLSELEEERRLMYVALTRAKQKLYLLAANQRILFGGLQVNIPSRFLSEIPEALIEESAPPRSLLGGYRKTSSSIAFSRGRKAQKAPATSETETKEMLTQDSVRPGDMVVHPEFGSGLIIALSGNLATIAFKERGVKKMMLGVAPLSKP